MKMVFLGAGISYDAAMFHLRRANNPGWLWLIPALACLANAGENDVQHREWRHFGGDKTNSQYSSLDQIHVGNVSELKAAWIYHCGDAREDNRSQIQCNPIVVDGVLYGTSPQLKLLALNAGTGELIWRFDPFESEENAGSLGVNRGVVCWGEGEERRILFTAGESLFAVDARTGKPIPAFGGQGKVSLKEGLGRDASDLYVLSNTPGVVYQDLLILGTRVNEGPGKSAPGYIRAYDVRTGAIRWVFHTIPHPGEFGYESWPADAWTRIGGANAWSGISVDEERGIVYLPTGSPAFDFWGGDRKGANLFGNCLLALDAASGKRVWHFQAVHHDLWDRDLPAAPNLMTVNHDGRSIDAVAQITKSGHVFLFDRETGEPLFPVEELPVPASDLMEEEAWATQPLPVKPPPFARQAFTEELATDISPEANEAVLKRLRRTRTGRPFIPPSETGTVIFPGFDGGGEWGGAAHDPKTGMLYVNANEMPWILTMVPTQEDALSEVSAGERVYRLNCVACHGLDRKGNPAHNVPPIDAIGEKLNRDQLVELLATGRGVMPSFAYLSLFETDRLIEFLVGEETTETNEGAASGNQRRGALDTPYTHTGYNRFFDPDGYPAVKPPWGTLNAIDMNKGEIKWQVPLGEFPELTEKGIPKTGTENYGGPAVTAGGLIFIAASKDEHIRAFDKETGEELWKHKLPAGGYATPCVYEIEGRQYVVIACGGGKMGTPSGDAYVAFALPMKQDGP